MIDKKWMPVVVFVVGILFGMILVPRNTESIIDLKNQISALEDSLFIMRMDYNDIQLDNLKLILILRSYRNGQ